MSRCGSFEAYIYSKARVISTKRKFVNYMEGYE